MFLKLFDPKFKKEWKIGSEIAGTNVCVCIVNIHTYYTITGVQQKKNRLLFLPKIISFFSDFIFKLLETSTDNFCHPVYTYARPSL